MQKVIQFILWSVALGAVVSLAAASQDGSGSTAEPKSACEALSAIKTMNSVVTATYIATREDFARSTLQSTGEEARPLFENAATRAVEAPVPFCRVEITSTPVAGAEIKSEVWLPSADKWNSRFLGAGNGGPAGAINPGVLAAGLAQGYATAHSDAGSHSLERIGEGSDPIGMRFGAVNKEWAINYAHRGYHTMTVVAKEATQTFYGEKPKVSLFMGCSGGGYEAVGEAWRYPEDYDGIIAGAPAIHFGHVGIWQGASYIATHKDPEAVIKSETLSVIYNHYMARCDALDGVQDGVIDNSPQCKIDFAPLQCKGGNTQDCFNPKQIAALNKIYAPLHHPVTKEMIYPGFPIGAELTPGAKARIANESVGSVINAHSPGALTWILPQGFSAKDWFSFDFATDTDKYLAAFAPYENGNPDLRAFAARGGKFILYTGWADPNLNPYDIIHYHENVKKAVGQEKAKHFTRLFMVPGMYHCGGGPGPNVFGQSMGGRRDGEKSDASNDILTALDRWVTEGVAPEHIIATKYVDDDPAKGVLRTRPLCAYPKVARWKGRGSTDEAKNFICASLAAQSQKPSRLTGSPPPEFVAAVEAMAANGPQGVTAAVMKDGRLLYRVDAGDIAPDAQLRIASATKWLTAALAMALVDDGVLTLDDPISHRLPVFTGKAGQITLRQLLAQTSGTGGATLCEKCEHGFTVLEFTQDPHWTLTQSAADVAAKKPLLHEPGTYYEYAGPGFQVAGALVEQATGKRWSQVFEERLGRPLGMRQTAFGHNIHPTMPAAEITNPLLQGGGISSADDYLRFLTMLAQDGRFEGHQIMSKAAVREMMRLQTGNAEFNLPDTLGYALGAFCEAIENKDRCVALISPGHSLPWIDYRTRRYGIFFLFKGGEPDNSAYTEAMATARKIASGEPAVQPAAQTR